VRRDVASLISFLAAASPGLAQPAVPGAELKARTVDELRGWREDDHAAALRAFGRTCTAIVAPNPPIRSAQPIPDGLSVACREALSLSEADRDTARTFFERRFSPFEVVVPAGRGFLTGYYEPEFLGSLEPSTAFSAPVLARPDDLVTLAPGEIVPNLPAGATAARRSSAGLTAYPDRATIEDGAIADHTRPVAYLRDAVDVFIVQVQGSARLKLPNGRVVRLAYDGRNGLPYTSVARLLVQRLGIAPAEMTADVLTGWLRQNPAEARELLRQNRSYVFFRIADELDAADGPVGAAGVPVTPGRTLAVDRTLWSFGLPVWIEGEMPAASGGSRSLQRLTVAQDTGSAITGPARGDLFFGSGEDAGREAGLLRNDIRFIVLWPKPEPASARAP
jgi:membrane-bound lytic murein transglycosylase A